MPTSVGNGGDQGVGDGGVPARARSSARAATIAAVSAWAGCAAPVRFAYPCLAMSKTCRWAQRSVRSSTAKPVPQRGQRSRSTAPASVVIMDDAGHRARVAPPSTATTLPVM